LSVRAYDAQDARRFNAGLLDQAEKLVNKLNERSRHDLLDVAQKEVDRARKQAIDAAQALAAYRDQAGVVDPEKQAEVQIQMVSKLQDQLIAARIQLDQMKVLAPASSEIAPLESRIAGLEQSIQSEMQRAAGGRSHSRVRRWNIKGCNSMMSLQASS
jgi:capsule polysaccharide export protein KpsE/RkpR